MATVVDSLVTKYGLDASNYLTNSRKAVSATNELAKAQQNLQKGKGAGSLGGNALSAISSGLKAAASAGSALGDALGPIGIVAAVAALGLDKLIDAGEALFSALKGPAEIAAEFDALVAALTAVEGSSKKAAKSLESLKKIAAGPGLGLEEAIGGYTQLRNAGLSSQFSERLVRELGNANAKAGGGPERLKNILTQISQAANKPFLQGDELTALTENGIPAYKLVRELFGTADTEQLKKNGVTAIQILDAITTSLEHSSRVASSAKNSYDNLGDAIKLADVSFGQGINESAAPLADTLTDVITLATDSGVFSTLAEDIKEALNVDDSNIKEVFIGVVASAKTAIQLLGALKDRFTAILGPVAGFLIDQAFSGLAGDDVAEIYGINDASVRNAMDAGTARKEMQDDRDKIAAKNPKEKGPLVDDPSMLDVIAKNTKEGADQTRRLADVMLNQQSLGGGAFAKDAVNAVNLGRSGRGLAGAERVLLQAIRDYTAEAMNGELHVERRHSRLSGAM